MTTIIQCDRGGERLDTALARLIPGLTRNAAQRLLEGGLVTGGSGILRKSGRTEEGLVLTVELPEPEPVQLVPQNIPLDIRYEDDDLIVVNKPKGLVVHPAAGHPDGTLVNALLFHCGDSLSGINGELRPGIVHRIDKDTSGLLAAAKNDFAHQGLAAQLAGHSLSRVYEAVVCGGVREERGTVDAPVGRHPSDRKRMAVTERGGRPAVTHYEVIARYRGYTHIRCRLETGRTHQIRVHMAYRNHPILGDMVYGHKKPELGQISQCLHAKELHFIHPRTGAPVTVTCELPDYFLHVLSRLEPV